MSDSSLVIVQLDPMPAAPLARSADLLVQWLRAEGTVVLNSNQDDAMRHSAWAPGPNWMQAAASEFTGWLTLGNNGVDVTAERLAHTALASYASPTCGRCGLPLDDETRPDASQGKDPIGAWLEGDEPTFKCRRCGWSALLGDWPGEWAIAVGAPAVTFNNWPPLRDDFLTALRSRMGTRSMIVRAHY